MVQMNQISRAGKEMQTENRRGHSGGREGGTIGVDIYTLLLLCYCWVTSVVSDSVWPHRRQPTRLPRPWDSPGRNTGVGCHFLLQCMKVKSESEVAQSCVTVSDPMDCSPPSSSIHGIFQARVLEWGAIAFFEQRAMISNFKSQTTALWFTLPVTRASGILYDLMSMGFAREGVAKEYIFWGVWIFEKGRFI